MAPPEDEDHKAAPKLQIRIIDNDSAISNDSSIPVLSPTSASNENLDYKSDYYESEQEDDAIEEVNAEDDDEDEDQDENDADEKADHEIVTARALSITSISITDHSLPEIPQGPPRPLSDLPRSGSRGRTVTEGPYLAPPAPAGRKMPGPKVPKPGPAKLTTNSTLAEWLEQAKQCHYLPEPIMKQLCEKVKECLMEGELVLGCVT